MLLNALKNFQICRWFYDKVEPAYLLSISSLTIYISLWIFFNMFHSALEWRKSEKLLVKQIQKCNRISMIFQHSSAYCYCKELSSGLRLSDGPNTPDTNASLTYIHTLASYSLFIHTIPHGMFKEIVRFMKMLMAVN